MGRGTVALVWLMMLAGIGAAFGMGEADGRKRAEGVAAVREQDYEYRLEQMTRLFVQHAVGEEARGEVATPGGHTADASERERLARAARPPTAARLPSPDAARTQAALAAEGL